MHGGSLRACNQNDAFRIRHCTARSSHSDRAEFILKISGDQESITSQIPAMMPAAQQQKMEK
jgi:hypothetical protein